MLKNIFSSLFTKGSVAIINLAILLISSKQLGGDIRGQISLLILNIAVIQIITEIYTGYALVYFIPRFSLKKVYSFGLLWTIACTIICALILIILFHFFKIGLNQQWIHLIVISFIMILNSFHCVIILAKEKIKAYNFLNLLQPLLLLVCMLAMIYYNNIRTVGTYIFALYFSLVITIIFSGIQGYKLLVSEANNAQHFEPISIIKNGFYNQLANLSHMLSNRYNFYLLGSTLLVGIYSSASSLIESVWIISGSVTPIILSFIANSKESLTNAKLVFLLSKICFLLSAFCVVVLYFLPQSFFTLLLGKDFSQVKTVMLYLSPGILFISFSTIISHYFSGLGNQRILFIANSFGLLVTLCTSHYFISNYQLLGACYATSLSYFTAAVFLSVAFFKKNNFKLLSLFSFKRDFELLKNGFQQ